MFIGFFMYIHSISIRYQAIIFLGLRENVFLKHNILN